MSPEQPFNLFSSLRNYLANQLGGMFRTMTTIPPAANLESVWYSGLVVDPTEFSRQLGSLHESIQRENARVKQPVTIGSRAS
jgi:hypothetical protein